MSFTFLAPLALVGLAALAVPLYLHLRHRPRAIPLPFSAIEFLLAAKKKRRKRLRFEQLLLMLARLLLIATLAVLFARPVLDAYFSNSPGFRSAPYVVILDDSASMLAGPPEARFFDEAKTQIGDLLDRRPGNAPTFLIPASNPSAFSTDATAQGLRPLLAAWRPTLLHVTLDEAYQKALDLIDANRWDRTTIHIFTDGSRTAWTQVPTVPPSGADVILTSMRRHMRSMTNSGIVSVQQPLTGGSAELEVAIHHSTPDEERVDVTLLADERPWLSHALSLAPWSTTSHRFDLGPHAGATISVVLPDDGFDVDNRAYFAPHQNRRIRVLIVDGDTQPNPRDSESFFFSNALTSRDDVSAYEVETITPAGLADASIASFDVVCLLNVAAPPAEPLLAALKSGTGVFCAMGNRIDFDSWNGFLRHLDLEVWETQHLATPLPATLKSPDHPIFSSIPIDEWELQLQGLSIQAFRLFSVGRSNFDIPLSLDDGTPMLLTRDWADGRIVIWASTVDLAWTNFPLQFAFLPVVRRSVEVLSGFDATVPVVQMTVDELARSPQRDAFNLKASDPLFAGLPINSPIPGLYSRELDQRAEWAVVHLDPEESDFRALDVEAASPDPAESLTSGVFREAVRTDLGSVFLWSLFLLVLLETGLATYISKKWGGR